MRTNRRFGKSLLALLALAACAQAPNDESLVPAAARTLYVATNGSDSSGDGSAARPFASLEVAGWAAKAGDTVLVRGGVYYPDNQQAMSYEGAGGQRVVFRNASGERPIIDGSRVQGPERERNTVVIGNNVEFRGFEVRNSRSIGIFAYEGGRNSLITENRVHGSYGWGIRADGSPGSTANLVVSRNTVWNNSLLNRERAMEEFWSGGIAVGRGTNLRVTDNRVYNNYGEGVLSFGEGSTAYIGGNTIFDNFSVELYLVNVTGTTAQSNFIYSTGDARYFRDGRRSRGILIANEAEGGADRSSSNVIKNNIVAHTGWGFYFGFFEGGGGLRNTLVANNTFHGNTEAALRIDGGSHTGSRVVNNIFRAADGAKLFINGGSSGVRFEHNLWAGGDNNPGTGRGSGDAYRLPEFAEAGGRYPGAYRLRSTSPAINAGTPVTQVDVAFDYVSRPQGRTYDMGAYEQ